jgi:hypothetical protein
MQYPAGENNAEKEPIKLGTLQQNIHNMEDWQ